MPQDLFPPSSSTTGLTDAELRASAVPVSAASLPLPTGAATETTVATLAREGASITGASMPAGGSYLMGWLSAIWKALTDRLPSSLVSGRLDVNVGNTATVTGSGGTFPVTDSGGSLTIDAPVGTPVFVRLSDGSSAIATLPVSAASLPLPTGAATAAKQPALGTAGSPSTDVITVQPILGGVAFPTYFNGIQVHDSAHDGNLLGVGGRASAATPTAVSADGDAVHAWFDLYGRLNTTQAGIRSQVALITRTGATTTYASSTINAGGAIGIKIYIEVTSYPATPAGLTVTLDAVDPNGNLVNDWRATTALTVNVYSSYLAYVGAVKPTTTGNIREALSVPLPAQFVIGVTHGDSKSYSYKLSYELLF